MPETLLRVVLVGAATDGLPRVVSETLLCEEPTRAEAIFTAHRYHVLFGDGLLPNVTPIKEAIDRMYPHVVWRIEVH